MYVGETSQGAAGNGCREHCGRPEGRTPIHNRRRECGEGDPLPTVMNALPRPAKPLESNDDHVCLAEGFRALTVTKAAIRIDECITISPRTLNYSRGNQGTRR